MLDNIDARFGFDAPSIELTTDFLDRSKLMSEAKSPRRFYGGEKIESGQVAPDERRSPT